MKWYESEATHEPLELDLDSSPNTVFLRRNIRQVEKEMDDYSDAESEEGSDEEKKVEPKKITYTAWVYEECKMTHDEYEAYLQIIEPQQEKFRSDIDYIAIMTEVDLDG